MIFTLIRIRGWGCLIFGDFFSEMRKFFNFCLDNRKQKWYNTKALRGVAQFGRALGSGANHRRGAPEGKRALCANGKITKVLANTEQNP